MSFPRESKTTRVRFNIGKSDISMIKHAVRQRRILVLEDYR